MRRNAATLSGLFDFVLIQALQQQPPQTSGIGLTPEQYAAYYATPEGQATQARLAAEQAARDEAARVAAENARIAAEQAAIAEAARLAALDRWEWAPDFSSAIYRKLHPEAFWQVEQPGYEGPGTPAGWRKPLRCDYSADGYGCSGGEYITADDAGFAHNYFTLRDAGLWQITDARSHTWDFLSYLGTSFYDKAYGRMGDARTDAQVMATAIIVNSSGLFVRNKWEVEPIKAGVREMLAGLNPTYIEAMANAAADYHLRYWTAVDEADHGFFGNFFTGLLSFAGELMQVPPLRAAFAMFTLGSSELLAEGVAVGAGEIAAEFAAEEVLLDFSPELAAELLAEEIAPEIAAELVPELAVEMLAAEVAPELAVEAIAPEVATEGAVDDFFLDEFVDLGDDVFFDLEFPDTEIFLDPFDLQPDPSIVFQEPAVMDMPLPAATLPSQISFSDVYRLTSAGRDIYQQFTQANLAAQTARSLPGAQRQLPALQRVAPGIVQPANLSATEAAALQPGVASGIVKLAPLALAGIAAWALLR